jgi:hypothetical protein
MEKLTGRDRDTGADPPPQPEHQTPRWVKVSGIVILVLVLAVIVMLLVGGGEHGPGRHAGGGAQPADVTEGHSPPAGVGDYVASGAGR